MPGMVQKMERAISLAGQEANGRTETDALGATAIMSKATSIMPLAHACN